MARTDETGGNMSICLRCGGKLPDNAYLTRKYCDKCAVERNKELTRDRQKKAEKRTIEVNAEKDYSADFEYCKPCVYRGSEEYGKNLCDYILLVGHRRGCKAGVGCEKRKVRENNENHA